MMQIDFGELALCNRFVEKKYPQGERGYYHPLTLVQNHLGLVQIQTPIPYYEMRPRFDWLTENEPVQHLNDASAMISNAISESDKINVLGVSYRDRKHAEILGTQYGIKEISYVNYRPYTSEENFKIETIQHLIAQKGEVFGGVYGRFDLILANRILHHVHDPIAFLSGISNMLSDDGCIYFEVPDCQCGFLEKDYGMIFEEHTLYFTKTSLCNLLESAGYEVQWCFEYMYPLENSLSVLVKKKEIRERNFFCEKDIFQAFVDSFSTTKKNTQRFFEEIVQDQRICLFGAGHQGCTFVNLFELSNYFKFAVDENLNKQDYYLPGTNLEIVSIDTLVNNEIDVCFFSVSQVNEKKVFEKIKTFSKNKIQCFSVNPKSPFYFPVENKA
jgi:SAM-dependent methyltransferase